MDYKHEEPKGPTKTTFLSRRAPMYAGLHASWGEATAGTRFLFKKVLEIFASKLMMSCELSKPLALSRRQHFIEAQLRG